MPPSKNWNNAVVSTHQTNDNYDTILSIVARANASDGAINSSIFFQPPFDYSLPEQKLMQALLQDALHCAYGNLLSSKGAVRERRLAREWIADNNPEYLFSFNSVCECLNLDPSYLRRQIGKLIKK